MVTLFLMVGLPAAGKTTRARELAVAHRALRLSPDEWMIPLFGDSDAGGRRDVLEGRLLSVALAALALGTDVVLDFGCWSRDERSAVHQLTRDLGARYVMEYLAVDRDVRTARVADRWRRTPEQTFPMTSADLERWDHLFDVPDGDERAGRPPGPAPAAWPDWWSWARDRWPSLERPDGATRASNT